jgi:undecaprenyl-diphosphatase
MTHPAERNSSPTDRRQASRSWRTAAWDPLYAGLRAARREASSFAAAIGIFLLLGTALAVAGAAAFAWVASHVAVGRTQAIDDAVMRWVAARQVPLVEAAMFDITLLGTGTVVMVMVAVAALFLSLTRHKYSALLLLVATAGGIVLNNVLKLGFDRPRPQLFEWGAHVVTTSFPSGHAMSAAIVYFTIAYLAARLQERRWVRLTTLTVAGVLVALIAASRVYLGVHYPSDVVAGVLVGLAWAGFCMATLEALQRLAARRAPHVLVQHEMPATRDDAAGRKEIEKAVRATGPVE